ncbi:MAG: hypothetical protein QHC79_25705 [Pseudosphingobacterium sp.]|nr:hypothetical protein [Pseudosphingobacterium sp.]
MILILSTDIYGRKDPIEEWLAYYHASYLRLSVYDLLNSRFTVDADIPKGEVWVDGTNLCTVVNVVWFRRTVPAPGVLFSQAFFPSTYYDDLTKEALATLEFVYHALTRQPIPRYHSKELNKMVMLNKAVGYGLRVPQSRLVSRRKSLAAFSDLFPDGMVSQPVRGNADYNNKESLESTSFHKVSTIDVHAMPEAFFASLYREYILPDYKIRIFYLDGHFFPISLLPLANEQNGQSADKRISAKDAANYQLKDAESTALKALLQDLNVNICTIDMAKKGDDLFLLDINPNGQYIFQSYQDNTDPERYIAEWLIAENNRRDSMKQLSH